MRPTTALLPGARVGIARRLAVFDRARCAGTVASIASSVALMLILVGVYFGVRAGSVSYIERQPVDLWVARVGTGNLLRSSSVFAASTLDAISYWPEVASASPLLRILVSGTAGGERSTLFLFGIDPDAPAGAPFVPAGRAAPGPGEMVLDRAFARRRGLSPGDTVVVENRPFRVVGIAANTNALVAQYAFGHIADVRSLASTGPVVSFGLLDLEPGASPDDAAAELAEAFPQLEFIAHDAFVRNNIREMEAGVLPVLWVLAVLAIVSSLSLFSILLHGAVTDQREAFALLMAIGTPARSITRIVVSQAAVLAGAGFAVGALSIPAIMPLLGHLVPELEIRLDAVSVAVVAAMAGLMALAGSLLPLRRVRSIWPGEVFRA